MDLLVNVLFYMIVVFAVAFVGEHTYRFLRRQHSAWKGRRAYKAGTVTTRGRLD